jgi:catechol 2,3-dioxygenase-like lactoylglutathione lyase family enzyme
MAAIGHVALAVADPDRSLAFYRDMIGIDGRVRTEEYGYVVETPNHVSFTLFRGKAPPIMGEFHVGVRMPTADEVRAFRDRVTAAATDVVEVEWSDEPDYVSCKVADPDGYVVEVSWEPR